MGERKLDYDQVKLEIIRNQRDSERIFAEQVGHLFNKLTETEKNISQNLNSINNKIIETEKTLSQQNDSSKSTVISWSAGILISIILGVFVAILSHFYWTSSKFDQSNFRIDQLNSKIDRKFDQMYSELRSLSEARGVNMFNSERTEQTNLKEIEKDLKIPISSKNE